MRLNTEVVRALHRDGRAVGVVIRREGREETIEGDTIIIHAPDVRVARIQNLKNWSLEMVADAATTCLGLEYFCTVGDALWQMSDADLIRLGAAELEKIGLVKAADVQDGIVVRQPKAYPVYTGEYKAYLECIRGFLESIPNLQTVGRNGLHMYNNQDHSMLTAMLAVRNLLGEKHDVWSVNVERSYHEEVRLPSNSETGQAQVPGTK